MNRNHPSAGLVIAILSAGAFGTSGIFARPLLDAGWSPGAAVALRTGAAGVVLLPLALRRIRGRVGGAARSWKRLVAFGIVGVAGTQLFFFAAVDRLPVGIALLIEYMGPVLLVGLTWAYTRKRPSKSTIAGAAIAVAGLFLVLDLTGASSLDPVGILFASAAAFCIAGYFAMSATIDENLPPVALAAGSLLVGTIALGLAGLVGALPFNATGGNVDMFGNSQPWWVPMAVVVLVSTSFAYVSGIAAATRLGARVASFVGLLEVVFTVLLAWLLLNEVPKLIQGCGGALILVGLILVRRDDQAQDAGARPLPL